MNETVLQRRVVPQPVPHLNSGGDCGPCVLAGISGISVADVYARANDGKPTSLSVHEIQRFLRANPDLFDRYIDEPPIGWPVYEVWHAWGSQPHHQGQPWFRYVRMAIEAGYYGIAAVSMQKEGPHGPGTDHWVMICGAREVRPEGEGRVRMEVLVSCSATSTPAEEWVDAWDFLRHRGGFNLLFARPR